MQLDNVAGQTRDTDRGVAMLGWIAWHVRAHYNPWEPAGNILCVSGALLFICEMSLMGLSNDDMNRSAFLLLLAAVCFLAAFAVWTLDAIIAASYWLYRRLR